MTTLAGIDLFHATAVVGIPAAVFLVVGLTLRDARRLDGGPRRRPGRRVLDVSLVMFGAALLMVLVARFLALT